MLKHVRWVRNQLAHEVGYDSDICQESDYDWLESFNQRLYSAEDPLALMNKQEKVEQQNRMAEKRRRAAEQKQRQTASVDQKQQTNSFVISKSKLDWKPSLWKRIKKFFTGS